MEGSLNNGMCRCCASEGTFKDVSSKYTWMGEEEIYSDMLRECFDITLANAEDEHNGICEVCITQLRNAANFKKQVQLTEEQFKKRLHDDMFKSNIIKLEVNALEEDRDGNNSDNNLSDDYSDYEVPIKTEDEPKGKKRGKAASSRAKKPKTEAESSKSKQKQEIERRFIPAKNRENLKQILLFSNASLIKSKTENGFTCSECNEIFTEPKALKLHFHEAHRFKDKIKLYGKCRVLKVDITDLKCKLCSKNFTYLENFAKHLADHGITMHLDVCSQLIPFKFDESDEFKCAICNEEYKNFTTLLEHTNTHYRNFICEFCDAGFVTQQLYDKHKKIHAGEEFKCDYCEKVFKTKNGKSAHEKLVHMRVITNKCKVCNLKFTNHWSKLAHMAKEHDMHEEHECKDCDKVFSCQRKLRCHEKKHHFIEKTHVCSFCNQAFHEKAELLKHGRLHSMVKNYQFDLCGMLSITQDSFAEHMKDHS